MILQMGANSCLLVVSSAHSKPTPANGGMTLSSLLAAGTL